MELLSKKILEHDPKSLSDLVHYMQEALIKYHTLKEKNTAVIDQAITPELHALFSSDNQDGTHDETLLVRQVIEHYVCHILAHTLTHTNCKPVYLVIAHRIFDNTPRYYLYIWNQILI